MYLFCGCHSRSSIYPIRHGYLVRYYNGYDVFTFTQINDVLFIKKKKKTVDAGSGEICIRQQVRAFNLMTRYTTGGFRAFFFEKLSNKHHSFLSVVDSYVNNNFLLRSALFLVIIIGNFRPKAIFPLRRVTCS